MTAERARAALVAPLLWRGALAALTAGVVVAELNRPWQTPAPAVPMLAAPGEGSRQGRPHQIAAADAAAIAEHPLFFPSRRPWVAPAQNPLPPPAAAPDRAPPSGYTLIGVILGDAVRRAVLRRADAQKTMIVSEGEDVDGWTLRAIRPDGLRFEANGAAYEMAFPGPRPADQ